MRTTLTIDDDVLTVARGLAERDDKTVGEVISDLARKALQTPEDRYEFETPQRRAVAARQEGQPSGHDGVGQSPA